MKCGATDGKRAVFNKMAVKSVQSFSAKVGWSGTAGEVMDGTCYTSSDPSTEIDMDLGFIRDQCGARRRRTALELWNMSGISSRRKIILRYGPEGVKSNTERNNPLLSDRNKSDKGGFLLWRRGDMRHFIIIKGNLSVIEELIVVISRVLL